MTSTPLSAPVVSRSTESGSQDLAVEHGIHVAGHAIQLVDLRGVLVKLFHRDAAQIVHGLAGEVFFEHLGGRGGLGLERDVVRLAGLGHHGGARVHDGALEQAPGQWRRHHGADIARPGRLARDGHPAGVAAERRDVGVHPFQRFHRIQHREAAGALLLHARQRQKAHDVEPVGRRDHDDAFCGQFGEVELDFGIVAVAVAAAVVVDHDRQRARGRLRRGPDVEIKAVFAVLGVLRRIPVIFGVIESAGRIGAGELIAAVRPRRAFLDPGPRHHRLRRAPAVFTDRGCRERHRLVDGDAGDIGGGATDLAAFHRNGCIGGLR